MIHKKSKTSPSFRYYLKGSNPKLLIHSGTHGDEWEVIGLVEEYLIKNKDRLPDFIFVPEVSPSAVQAKTRVNGNGFDLNRIFFPDSKEIEIVENIKIIDSQKFDLFVSFHEDATNTEYYIYDVGNNETERKLIKDHNKKLKENGIELLNGVDDEDDPDLGYKFIEGYKKFVHENSQDSGMIGSFLLNRNIIKEELIPEIPGKINAQKKKFIVESFFDDVILKWK